MESWLKGLRLEQYSLKLATAGFISLNDCSGITEPDLIQLDVLPGHRKRMLMNIPVPCLTQQFQDEDDDDDESVYQNIPALSRPPHHFLSEQDEYVPPGYNGWGLEGYEYDTTKSMVSSPVAYADDVYDVPQPRPQQCEADEEDSDEELYVNIKELNASISTSQPPLPPKTTSSSKRKSITDEMLGAVTLPVVSVEIPCVKRPVPAPRTSLKPQSTSKLQDMPLGVSLDTALDTALNEEKQESPKRPTPKPRKVRPSTSTSSVNGSSIGTPNLDNLPTIETDQEVMHALSTLDDVIQEIDDNAFVETEIHSEKDEPNFIQEPPAKVPSPITSSSNIEEHIYEPVEIKRDIKPSFETENSNITVPETTNIPSESHLPSSFESSPYGEVWVMSSGKANDATTPHKFMTPVSLQPILQPVKVSSIEPVKVPMLQPIKPPTLPLNNNNDADHEGNVDTVFSVDSVSKSKALMDTTAKAQVENLKLQFNFPPEVTDGADNPGVFGVNNILWEQFAPYSRDSTLSFSEPPPNFAPPPLPPQPITTTLTSGPPLIRPMISSIPNTSPTIMATAAPPVIPPRPRNYPVRPESPNSPTKPTPPLLPEASTKQRLSSKSSIPSLTMRTQVPVIPEEHDVSVLYDTPAPASGPLTYASNAEPEKEDYIDTHSMSSASRSSTSSFTDLATNRLDMSPSSLGACAHLKPLAEAEKPHAPVRSTSTSSMYSHQENIYVDSPLPVFSTPLPPVPPPRTNTKTASRHETGAETASNFADFESDDTLSDGGEFLELRHLRPAAAQASIPIVPAQANSIKERKGYLYKLPSRRNQKRLGWRKRWVTFDGEELMYFSDEKSDISKRIIPLSTIVNVEQQIKGSSSVLKRVSEMGDMHPYEFKLTTIDRVYRFAADDGDDLALWTSILMRAIIDSKPEKFEEGGCMARPDREGFVRMEGLKGRQYLVIRKDKFCYYNTFSDYKVGTPIHRVDLTLSSVKDAGKGKLILTTPRVSFGLLCEGKAELSSWKEAFEEGIADGLGDNTILKEVYENQNNRLCVDCGTPDPHWASINLGVTMCKQCAGIHRMLTDPTSKIRSLRMDFRVWTPTLIQMLQKIGNENSNNFWEWNSTEDDRIDSDADMGSREEYILAKYRDKRFFHFHPLRGETPALHEALCKSVQYGDVLQTLQALYSGADIQCTTSSYGDNNETPLQLARKAKQTLQVEFLFQNGAKAHGQSIIRQSSMDLCESGLSYLQSVSMKGYLHKQQTNQREYNRRWFKLERGILSYFDNDKSTQAKDSIERKEIMSVAAMSDDKFEFGFEVVTTKVGGRVYTMATDTAEERHHWMLKIAKSFAPLPSPSLDKIKELDRGGNVFLREGATTDWQMTWIHLKKKILYIYNKEEQAFSEIDLRKVTGMSKFSLCTHQTLQRTDLCVETFDEGPPFVVDLPNRAVYIQGDTRAETEAWYNLIKKVSTGMCNLLIDLQLMQDDVPVIVEKCINFVSAHGMRMEGLYRLNGQHSKVGQLLDEFKSNAQNVFLCLDLYQVHDVATAFKRLFRKLDEPLLTNILFSRWLETSNMTEDGPKLQWYKYLLGELPTVHYATLKRLITHLARVGMLKDENKMSELNLASIFGPILMKVDTNMPSKPDGYGSTSQEISVCLDLIANHKWLFEIKDDDLEHERKMQEAVEKIERASRENQKMRESVITMSSQAGELLVGIYVLSRDGDVITLKVTDNMTAHHVLRFIESKAGLDPTMHWGLYEVICQNQLERPLHYLERVLDVNLRWSTWSEEFYKDNYLVVKPNVVMEKVKVVFDPHFSLFNEFKFSDKKAFKKFYFDFTKSKLSYQKDSRGTNHIGSWNIEDLVLYIGIEQKRNAPTKWGITFLSTSDKIIKSKDSPHFGRSISCLSEDEMFRWLAAMLHAQHPGGLVPEGMKLPVFLPDDPPLPIPQVDDIQREEPARKKSFLQKLRR